MKRLVLLAALAATLFAPQSSVAGVNFSRDVSWQAQFSGAVKWSTLGINDDSGATDNTTTLNNIALNYPNTPIIADCPHGGYVSFSGQWHWQSGLTVWQQPGCWLKSTLASAGVYPIIMPSASGGSDTSPITNVQYYGMNFSFITATTGDRVMQLWVDYFKFKYFNFSGTGGGLLLRGSDQEVAFGAITTLTPAGNPGIRHFGTDAGVTVSAGMRANDWFHNLNIQSGDAAFQTCQPVSGSGNWFNNISTNGVLYENSYGFSNSSAVILVNLPQSTGFDQYSCENVTYRNVQGAGTWFASIGNSTALTSNVLVTGGSYDGSASASNLPSFGIGLVRFGGGAATSANTSGVTIQGVAFSNVYQDAIEAIGGVTGLTITGNTIGQPRVGVASPGSTIALDGASGTIISHNSIAAGNNVAAVGIGIGSNVTTGALVFGNTISGATNGKNGMLLGNSSGGTFSGNTITPAAGATSAIGIGLTVNPSGTTTGTNGAAVTGNDVSSMPTPIACASGQGNVVTNNTGASACP